jgi:hypothetical protein
LSHADLLIRTCSENHLRAVLGLWSRARSEHASTFDRPEDLRRLLAEQPGSVLVAELDWPLWRANRCLGRLAREYVPIGCYCNTAGAAFGLALVRA